MPTKMTKSISIYFPINIFLFIQIYRLISFILKAYSVKLKYNLCLQKKKGLEKHSPRQKSTQSNPDSNQNCF